MKNYRIYINKKVLIFAEDIPKTADKFQQIEEDDFDFTSFYKNLKKSDKRDFIVVSKKPKRLFKALKKHLNVIKAAGGLVENAEGDLLFIFRNKKWDLPKGKVEKGESLKEAAVREVEEECGVKIERREKCLCKTYHVYELNGKLILKRTNWYKMFVKGVPKLIPQKEEGITTACWVGVSGIKTKMNNTYPLILDVLAAEKLIN